MINNYPSVAKCFWVHVLREAGMKVCVTYSFSERSNGESKHNFSDYHQAYEDCILSIKQ